MKKKVLFVSTFAYPLFDQEFKGKFGGSEVQMRFLAKELAKDDEYDVHFAVLDMGQEDKEIDGISFHKTYKRGKGAFNVIKAFFKIRSVIKISGSDVVICRAAGPEVGVCAFWARLLKKKMIYSIAHDRDVDSSRFKGFFGKVFEYGFKRADHLVAQSLRQVEILKEYSNKDVENVSIIKNSFPVQRRKNDKEKEYILWVGRAVEFKRPELFISLAKLFPDEKFLMVMAKGGRPELWQQTKDEAQKAKNLEMVPDVAFNEVEDYFAKAKIFINTSEAEGFPNTFLQAAFFKAPILSLDVDPDSFLSKSGCGLCAKGNMDKLEDQLENLLDDEQVRQKTCDKCEEYLLSEHNLERNIEKWKKVINEL